MNKAKAKTLIGVISLTSLAAIIMTIPFSLSLFIKDAESEGFYGEVSLRSYFECGTGRLPKTNGPDDPGDPYVITRPRHLYNLSRLQGLGVFNEKKYFQLGLVGLHNDTSGKPLCYLDDASTTTVPFLNMEDSNFDYEPITAIGTEAVPFFGEFDGQGLEIKNLNVYGDPEDIGLFGYTAHGSNVHDLFLDNVIIHARGFTSQYAGLYGASSTAGVGTSFTYACGSDTDTFTSSDTEKIKNLQFDASPIFEWDGTGDEPTISEDYPVIGFTSSNINYKYKFLISGDFLSDIGNNQVKIDLPAVYKFFKKEKDNTLNFPLQAVSTVSLVASTTDNYGLDHSKVIMTLDFHFALNTASSNSLFMTAKLGEDHNNNIGLLIGHCDGSVANCYVHNGKFDMNGGDASYTKMQNSSNFGLIGLVGGTVHNFAAEESGAGTAAGKDIGVLDFTTVYNDIITPTSFNGSGSFPGGGVTYVPSSETVYEDYLRYGNGSYVTLASNTVSFNRQKVIKSTDLGIFTIATDQTGTGMGADASSGLANSVVNYEDCSINNDYFVYYATGEYDKTKGISFAKYRDGVKQATPEQFFPGYHFPNYDQISTQSFEQRDAHQNYIVRFKVDSTYRTGKGFYFSDVDKTSPGGSFMSHYFENKLVDKDGNPILASSDSKLSGIMLRNSLGQEIRSFSSSFATPDLSPNGMRMYCIDNEEEGYPAANMINFEIKTNTANVTVIAGQADISKPAALGVYKIGKTMAERQTYGGVPYVNVNFEAPDYAFFMPAQDHLAYFDYMVDNDVGKIGVYNSTGTVFTEATTNTEATIPSLYNASEYGYSSGKTRLYAHTFKLEPGRYCLASATGPNRSGGNSEEGLAKIFYVCAQGQTDGNIQLIDNTFASEDEVKNVDFTKIERYSYNQSTGEVTINIVMGDVNIYNANDPHIENQRLYVSLLTIDRSLFDAAQANVEFVYEDTKFKIKTDNLAAMLRVVVSNYARNHQQVTGLTNTTIKLFDLPESNADKITYPAP